MAKRKPKHLQLMITLHDVQPPIWRRVLVASDTTLHELHNVIQFMFEWYDYHLYEFTIRGVQYQAPDPEAEAEDSTLVRLRDFEWSVGDEFTYLYDFGDDWVHNIRIEKGPPRADHGWLPYVLSGERRGPPEDCGGVGGFLRFLEAIADPEDPEHDEYWTWVGRDYDPELFDVRTIRHAVLLGAASSGG